MLMISFVSLLLDLVTISVLRILAFFYLYHSVIKNTVAPNWTTSFLFDYGKMVQLSSFILFGIQASHKLAISNTQTK